jgi:hypothetical protein
MQGGWHDFDIWRERRRDLLKEAEAQRLARAARPDWRGHLEKYRPLLNWFSAGILGFGREVVSSRIAFPPDEEVVSPGREVGLVEAQVSSSSVIEFHREAEGYVIQEVDLDTGDNILYLSTEEPEWAAWIWEQKIHR